METIRVTGSVGDDPIFGLGGNEVLAGLAGADLLDGGTGTDTATYAASLAGVNVNLMTGAAGGRHETCWILRP
jgi:Ca2+-binding RTX toxin-like protein